MPIRVARPSLRSHDPTVTCDSPKEGRFDELPDLRYYAMSVLELLFHQHPVIVVPLDNPFLDLPFQEGGPLVQLPVRHGAAQEQNGNGGFFVVH